MSNVFCPHAYKRDPEHLKEVHNYVNSKHDQDESTTPKLVTKSKVKETIAKLDQKKAPGYDLITGRVLRELPDVGIVYLTQLFNAILKLKYFPPQWKVALVKMILKPDKPPEDAKSYRPISLLPIPSKLLERIMLSRIMHIIGEENVIPGYQFGFRAKHGTIDQIHRLAEKITQVFEDKEYCTAVFLDISQAFDRVWHDGLLYKIKKIFPNDIYLVLKSYLADRRCLVKYGEAVSTLFSIKAGVPQGSVLGPTLYLLQTADLLTSNTATFGYPL